MDVHEHLQQLTKLLPVKYSVTATAVVDCHSALERSHSKDGRWQRGMFPDPTHSAEPLMAGASSEPRTKVN